MQIKILPLHIQDQEFTRAAEITLSNGKSHRLFYTVSKTHKKALISDATPFLAAMLPVAMRLKEDIVVEGTVSKAFLANSQKIISLLSQWNVGLSKITITASTRKKDTQSSSLKATFFSAGVDSFYTYLMHQTDIQSFLLVHGFDIELKNKTFFAEVRKTVQKVAKHEHKQLIIVKTNIKEITDIYMSWDFAHGAALASVGLLLRSEISHVYIAGAVRKDQLFPYGTHPKLDPLWSTEKLTFSHDGNERTRLEKLRDVVTKSDLAMNNLRVCCQNKKGKYNCSTCFKCLNTMIQLTCVHALKRAKTFDQTVDLQAVRNMYYNYALKYNYFAEANLAILQKEKREVPLQEAISYSLEKSKHPTLLRRSAFFIAMLDKKYNKRRLFNFIFQITNKEDRTFLFKMFAQKGIIK